MNKEEEIYKYRQRLKPYIEEAMAKLKKEHTKNVFKSYLKGKKNDR
jgi:hypothetical protein